MLSPATTRRTQWIQYRRIVIALFDIDLQVSGHRTRIPSCRADPVFAHKGKLMTFLGTSQRTSPVESIRTGSDTIDGS